MISPNEQDARFAHEKLAACCDAMKHLLQGLQCPKGPVADDIHAIRKLGKSLRGGFSLFSLSATSAREIQAIGRLLSGPRDAVSRLSTWQKLGWNEDPSVASAIIGLLEQQAHSAALSPPAETISWCTDRLDAATRNLQQASTKSLANDLARRLAKLHRKLCKRCRNLGLNGKEDFHEARKALKAYLGAVDFLPKGRIPLDPKITEIAEILGDENDLTTLSAWLKSRGFTRHFVPSLWIAITQAHRTFQKQAIRDVAAWASARES